MEKQNHPQFYKFFGIGFLILLYLFAIIFAIGVIRTRFLGVKLNNADLEEEAGIEQEMCAAFPLRYGFIEGNGLMRLLLGQREMNGVWRLDNGFVTPAFEKIPEDVLQEEANAMIGLQTMMDKKEIPFLYVAPAVRTTELTEADYGVYTAEAENDRIYIDMLKAGQVVLLDLEEELQKEGIDRGTQYFKGDHHWNMEGARYCSMKITEWLGDVTNKPVELSILDKENLEEKSLGNVMLGSFAERTGSIFAGGFEDFTVFLPKRDTLVKEQISGKIGSIEELFYPLEGVKRSYQVTTYETVFGREGMRLYINEKNEGDLRVLLMEDSFGYSLEPYLIEQVKVLHLGSSYSPESITEALLDVLKPDAVIMLKYGPFHLGHEEYFRTGE